MKAILEPNPLLMVDMTTVVGPENIRFADALIRPYIRETALERSFALESGEGSVWLKLENQQVTGSFKARGALNKLLRLSDVERAGGIVTASSGNHGLGVAFAADKLNVTATIYLPSGVDKGKTRLLDNFQVELRTIGNDCGDAERYARDVASKTDRIFISPYNDLDIIAGQGTVGLEIARQLPEVETIIVAVGGGGLLAGIATYAKGINNNCKIVAVSPSESPAMFDELMNAPDELRTLHQTLSDGTAGSIEKGSITIGLCKALIDEWVLVEEEEIAKAMRFLFNEHRLVVEGAGALCVAAYLKEKERYAQSNTVLVVCGGNVAMPKFREVVLGKGK